MAYDFVVYLARSKMPPPSTWRSSIIEQGFPVELDDDFDVDSFSGFLPCLVHGAISGFEYYASPVTPEDANELGVASDVDFSVQFSIGSRPLELLSALAASSVLAALSYGTLTDPQTGELVHGQQAVAWAKVKSTGGGPDNASIPTREPS
jgi:hypothetical protein